MAASKCLVPCANMALAEYDHLIPLNEVHLETMYESREKHSEHLKMYELGGLSITRLPRKSKANFATETLL